MRSRRARARIRNADIDLRPRAIAPNTRQLAHARHVRPEIPRLAVGARNASGIVEMMNETDHPRPPELIVKSSPRLFVPFQPSRRIKEPRPKRSVELCKIGGNRLKPHQAD